MGLPVDEMRATTSSNERRYRVRMLLIALGVALLLGAAGVGGSALVRKRFVPKAASTTA
jgi:hypothetical protein